MHHIRRFKINDIENERKINKQRLFHFHVNKNEKSFAIENR